VSAYIRTKLRYTIGELESTSPIFDNISVDDDFHVTIVSGS
jgi:hypothetical protein